VAVELLPGALFFGCEERCLLWLIAFAAAATDYYRDCLTTGLVRWIVALLDTKPLELTD
jgi:hypothetical protein